jgi:hypothetical protein
MSVYVTRFGSGLSATLLSGKGSEGQVLKPHVFIAIYFGILW